VGSALVGAISIAAASALPIEGPGADGCAWGTTPYPRARSSPRPTRSSRNAATANGTRSSSADGRRSSDITALRTQTFFRFRSILEGITMIRPVILTILHPICAARPDLRRRGSYGRSEYSSSALRFIRAATVVAITAAVATATAGPAAAVSNCEQANSQSADAARGYSDAMEVGDELAQYHWRNLWVAATNRAAVACAPVGERPEQVPDQRGRGPRP
jgi:hypothetical protein